MAILEIREAFHPLGPDEPRELERKLNNNYRELCAAAGVEFSEIKLTVSSSDGRVDGPRTLEFKLNRMNRDLAAAAGLAAPELVYVARATPQPATLLGDAPKPSRSVLPARGLATLRKAVAAISTALGTGAPVPVPTPTPVPSAAPLRFATTNQRTADLNRTVTSTTDRVQQRTMHLLGGAVTEIRLGVTPRYMTTDGEGTLSGTYSVDGLALEVDGVGTYPATFNGLRTRVVDPSEVFVWSDPVVLPANVLAALQQDTKLWVRAQFTALNLRLPICTAYLIGTSASWSGNASYLYPSADTQTAEVMTQVDAQGALVQPAGNQTSGVNNNMRLNQASNTGHTVPVYVGAKFVAPTSVLLAVGDSNTQGVGDPDVSPSYGTNGSIGGRSFVGRASVVSETAPWQAMPVLNTGLSAMMTTSWNTNTFRKAAMQYATHMVEAMGTNDVQQGADGATVLAARRAIWADAKAAGLKVIALTVPPRTNSASNNTPYSAGFAPGGAAQVMNYALPDEVTAGRIDAYLNTRAFVSDPADDTIWATPASTYVRTDGVHYKSGSTTRIAPRVRSFVTGVPALLAVVVNNSAATVGQPFTTTLRNLTPGSTLALGGAGAAGLTLAGAVISGTPTTAGPVDVVETLAGATNSPRTATEVITVSAAAPAPSPAPAPTLAALTVSSAAATVGSAFTATLSGVTSGSTLSLAGAGAAGLAVSGTTISGTPTAAGAVDVVETLSGATNSPRTTSGLVTVSAAAPAPAPVPAPAVSEQYWLTSGQLSWPTGTDTATTSANTYSMGAKTMKAPPWAAKSPRFCFHNFYRSGATTAEVVVGGTFTIEAAYVELPDGTRRQLFFGGSPSATFTGGTGKFAWTDEDMTVTLSADADYRLIWAEAAAVGTARASKGAPVIPAEQYASAQGGDVFVTGASSFASNAASGALPTSLPPGTFMAHAPCLAVTYGARDGRDVVLGVGDSIWRYHHMYAGYGARNFAGNFGYGAALANTTNGRIPYGNLSVSSTGPINLRDAPFANRKAMLAAVGYPFTKILSNMGRNSQNSNSKAEFDAMWAFLGTLTNGAAKPVVQTTITPVSSLSSTSGGTTLSGQTSDSSTYRDSLNEYIRSLPAGLSAYLDVNLAVEQAAGGKKWPVPGFSTTLTQAAAVGDTTIYLAAAPQPGDFLSVGVGSSTNEDVFVTTVSGTGPYAVGIQNAGQYTGGIKTARASGVAVGGQATIDGTHPSTQVYLNVMAPVVVNGKQNGVLVGNNTPAPTVGISGAQSKPEGDSGTTVYAYTVTRSTSVGAASVPWTLSYGTTDANDFESTQATSGTLVIPDGATTGTINILVKAGTIVENDETFTVTITPPATYNSGAALSATGTIVNDDVGTPATSLPTTNRAVHYKFSDPANLYQDSARTTLVTADGQAVQSVTCTGSIGAHTTGTATYRANVANGKGGVQYNGTSDTLQSTVAAIATSFGGTDLPFIMYEVQKITALPAATAAPLALTGTGFFRTSYSTSNNYSVGKRNNSSTSTSVISDTAQNPAVGDVVVWAYRHNANGTADLFKNGVLVKTGSTPTGATSVAKINTGSSVATGSGATAAERYWAGIHLEVALFTGTQTEQEITSNSLFLRNQYVA